MQAGTEPRYIRITDFGEHGIPEGHEFTTPDVIEPECKLFANDLLFARSGATVGKTYLHQDTSHTAIFAGYCIRFRFNPHKALPKFVWFFTKTGAFARWILITQRPSGQPNINKEEFKSAEMPVPPLQVQSQLVAAMEAALEERRVKLAEADALLGSFDRYLLDTLGHAIRCAVSSTVLRKGHYCSRGLPLPPGVTRGYLPRNRWRSYTNPG